MRQFLLENEVGAVFPLNGEIGATLADVSGLGAESNIDTADLSEGFFAVIHNTSAEQTVTGTVYMPGRNCHEVYAALIDFVMKSNALYIGYKPKNTLYRRRVSLNYIAKNEGNPRAAAISLLCHSPWYKALPLPVVFADPTAGDALRWNVSAWGSAPWAASTEGSYSANITPEGHIPAALRVQFTGSASDPVFTLTGLSGTVYGRCSIEGDFTDVTITLDTRYGAASIESVAGGTGTDLLDVIDITSDPFFRVPATEPCILTVSGSDIEGTVQAKMYAYYRSV